MATGYIMLDAPNTAQPQGGFPRRGGFLPSGTCIVHTSEGDWRAGVDSLTRLVQTRTDYGCYHVAVDWVDTATYYPWWWECWQDSETNNWAVGIAAACRTSDWGNMPADIEEGFYRNLAGAAADFVVYMKSARGIDVPLRRITGAQARAGVPGFCAHGDSGVGRTDPGARFDWVRFFDYTRQALNPEENDMQADERAWLKEMRDRIIGRDVQRWLDPKTGAIHEDNAPGRVPMRSSDLHDVLALRDLINANTDKVLAAVAGVTTPKLDLTPEQVDQLAAKLKDTLAPGLAQELARRLAAE